MSIWRLQLSWQYDTVAPRDAMVITPHFEVLNPNPDVQQLCEDMVAGVQGITNFGGEVRCKGYDAQGSKPVYPEGDAIVNKGLAGGSARPRELAVCLSFYGSRNVKRQRGRLYMPCDFLGVNTGNKDIATPIPKLNSFAALLQGLGGVDVDWVVYSRITDNAHPVTNWWYDNEFDVMRSRGQRGTTRITGTTSEAADAAIEVPLR